MIEREATQFIDEPKVIISLLLLMWEVFPTFLPVEFLGTKEEEESRSDNQQQEDIDGAGEVEQCKTKK